MRLSKHTDHALRARMHGGAQARARRWHAVAEGDRGVIGIEHVDAALPAGLRALDGATRAAMTADDPMSPSHPSGGARQRDATFAMDAKD